MRAINLVPADARPGRVNGGKSGGAVYGVLGVLVVLVLAVSVLAMSKRDETRAQQQLTSIQDSTQAYTRIASQFSSFEAAAKQANERIAAVKALADARFDWAGALRDLSRLVPDNANISALSASVDPSASSGSGGGGSASQLRGNLPVPAVSMTGCAFSQGAAANLVNQLQAMRRVTNVTLESSELAKQDGGGSNPFEAGGCQGFEYAIVVFFAPGNAKSAATAATSGTTTVSTESAGGTTPPSTSGSN